MKFTFYHYRGSGLIYSRSIDARDIEDAERKATAWARKNKRRVVTVIPDNVEKLSQVNAPAR